MRFIDYSDLRPKKGIPYSRQWLQVLENAEPPRFPRRIQIGPNRIAWIESEIDAWLATKAAARDQREAAVPGINPKAL